MQQVVQVFGTLLVLMLFQAPLWGQPGHSGERINFAEYNLGGPRLGVTVVPNGGLLEELQEQEMDGVLSQFGWHFEYQIIPDGGGPAFVIQMVPMVTGVEYGKLVPHGTLAMGIRMPSGIEFGMGPNLLWVGDSLRTSLILGVGKTFNYGGVNIPLNLTFATNPDGYMLSFIFGYSITRGRRRG